MNISEFYTSLPSLEQASFFYVPFYTESLKVYRGVRVVPDESFIESLPKKDQEYFKSVGFPSYFVPLLDRHNNCYGYVCKGREKKTPRSATKHYLPGWYSIVPGQPVVLVEGFKDSYLLRKAGVCCLPMLTSMVSNDVLKDIELMGCPVVYVPDNDQYRSKFVEKFKSKIFAYKISYYVFMLEGVKDLGDWFSPNTSQVALQQAKKIVHLVRKLSNVQIHNRSTDCKS